MLHLLICSYNNITCCKYVDIQLSFMYFFWFFIFFLTPLLILSLLLVSDILFSFSLDLFSPLRILSKIFTLAVYLLKVSAGDLPNSSLFPDALFLVLVKSRQVLENIQAHGRLRQSGGI